MMVPTCLSQPTPQNVLLVLIHTSAVLHHFASSARDHACQKAPSPTPPVSALRLIRAWSRAPNQTLNSTFKTCSSPLNSVRICSTHSFRPAFLPLFTHCCTPHSMPLFQPSNCLAYRRPVPKVVIQGRLHLHHVHVTPYSVICTCHHRCSFRHPRPSSSASPTNSSFHFLFIAIFVSWS